MWSLANGKTAVIRFCRRWANCGATVSAQELAKLADCLRFEQAAWRVGQSSKRKLMMSSVQDHYARLGVASSASAEAIKAAYRKKAAQYHPDKNPSPDAAARFREVQQAYEVLGDAQRRKDFDDYRQRSLIEDPLPVAREIAAKYIEEAIN
jgi:DnaJ-domain-containing protein 1